MFSAHFLTVAILFITTNLISAQISSEAGYVGYSLTENGDPESVVYATNSTTPNVSVSVPEPDVFLNASVHVGEIYLDVQNITAKINLQASVLSLLKFNAGVVASIDRVTLLIQKVDAKVILEARLENLVSMIKDVLSSIDLNPILVTLGQDISSIVNTTTGILTDTASNLEDRSFLLAHNILYSVNDYSGRTHTNRVLAQNGSIVDQSLGNDGVVYGEKMVGFYLTDMTFNGYNHSVTGNSQADRELEYVYTPYTGLSVICAIFTNYAGAVVGTQVLSESGGGGSSSISKE